MNGLLGYLLVSRKRKNFNDPVLTGVALNLGLTWPLTSAFGIKGTAIGTLVATAAVTRAPCLPYAGTFPACSLLEECWRRVIPYAATALLLLLPSRITGLNYVRYSPP